MTEELCIFSVTPKSRKQPFKQQSSQAYCHTPRRQRALLEGSHLQHRREEALERLITALEAAAAPDTPALFHSLLALPVSSRHRLNQMARLRAAHAAYSLQSGSLHKTGTNAWIRERRAA